MENRYVKELRSRATYGDNGYEKLFQYPSGYRNVRNELIRKYSFAIPNEEALSVFSKYEPIVEVGCGDGYWSYLLQERDVSVVATDVSAPASPWTKVRKMCATKAVSKFPRHTVFFCWPEYGGEWSHKTLEHYSGDTVIYVGDEELTGSDGFHSHLEKNFKKVLSIPLPTWERINDGLRVFERDF